jgi:hypothetical protein
LALFLLALASTAALAQAPTTTRPNISTMGLTNCAVDRVLLGGGALALPPCSTALTNGQLLVGQTGAAPLPKSITGDVTFNAAGQSALGNIPSNTTQAGTIISTAAGTPGAAGAGKVAVYSDSTSLTYAALNNSSVKSSMAFGSTCAAGSLYSAFSVSTAAFTCTDISASQAQQAAFTSTTVYVTPGRQQFHPSASKAWVYWTVSGTTPTVQASYNVSSVVRNGVGDYTITFTTGFASTAYAQVCNTYTPGINTGQSGMIAGGRATGSFRVFLADNAGGAKDNTENNCTFNGTQ